MSTLLLVTLLGAGFFQADADKPAAPKLDGKWLIVYSEENGRRNTAWEAKVATVSGKTLSYEVDKKKHSLELTFGDGQTVKVKFSEEEGKGGAYQGVAITARDYLCLSLNPEKGGSDKKGSGAAFILILRRQREK
jgi:hypothetical protein